MAAARTGTRCRSYIIRVVALPKCAIASAVGSAASKKDFVSAADRSLAKLSKESPSAPPVAFPFSAVPASIPSASNRASDLLPFGSVMRAGCRIR